MHHRPDSDADIAVLLHGCRGHFLDTQLALADMAYEVLLETGVLIQPLPVWENEWRHPETYKIPLCSATSAATECVCESG